VSRVRENRMPGSTGGSWKRSDWSGSPKWDNPTGNRGHQGFWTYRQNHATAPVPDPTQPCTGPSVNRRESCPHGRTATASTGRVEPRPGGGDEPVDVDHPAGAASGRGSVGQRGDPARPAQTGGRPNAEGSRGRAAQRERRPAHAWSETALTCGDSGPGSRRPYV